MEFEEELQNIGEGWRPIVAVMHAAVLEIDPDIKILQIKEKFGGLRYYFSTELKYQSDELNQINSLIAAAEAACEVTCEDCGKEGKRVSISGWLRTLCPEDADKALARRREMFK